MRPLSKQTIKITIIDDSNNPECIAECGVDWSSEEAIILARQRVEDRFGHSVELQYLDLAEATTSRDATGWHKLIKDRNLSLPLLLLNGHPRISGQFDIRQLIDAIDAEMEMEG